jgi:hypothetical protein
VKKRDIRRGKGDSLRFAREISPPLTLSLSRGRTQYMLYSNAKRGDAGKRREEKEDKRQGAKQNTCSTRFKSIDTFLPFLP